MSTDEIEYEAVARVAKADRRFRIVSYLLLAAVVMMFITVAISLYRFQQDIKHDTQRLLNQISSKVDKGLKDNQIQNEETRRYITCLFVIPLAERTPEAQKRCEQNSDLPGGLSESEIATSSNEVASTPAPAASDSNQVTSSSSPQRTPEPDPSQPDNSQSEPEPVKVFGIPVCVPLTKVCG